MSKKSDVPEMKHLYFGIYPKKYIFFLFYTLSVAREVNLYRNVNKQNKVVQHITEEITLTYYFSLMKISYISTCEITTFIHFRYALSLLL